MIAPSRMTCARSLASFFVHSVGMLVPSRGPVRITSSRSFLVRASVALALLFGRAAHARPGQPFPPLTAADLVGKAHRTTEFVGKVTIVVAMTDRAAADAMSAWYAAADSRIPESVARKSIISLHMPFFVTTSYARDQARSQVPPRFWSETLLDRGGMADTLGLSESKVPYVYALDERGSVIAEVHAPVQSPDAQKIWSALTR